MIPPHLTSVLRHGPVIAFATVAALPFAARAADLETNAKHARAFEKHQLSTEFFSEGASFDDLNQDGHNDLVSGPYAYLGPDYLEKLEIYPPQPFNPSGYSDNFFSYTYDFNGDGWVDVLVFGFPGKDASWFQNPGAEGQSQGAHWRRHVVFDVVDNESPTFTDLTGDGKPEIVCSTGGVFGYVTPDWSAPEKPWTFHPISPPNVAGARFTHGLGVGDVNGDGRMDLLEKNNWWEQPESLEGDPVWKGRKISFSTRGGSQMFAYDFDGDGDNDILTALVAHGYGLAWYEQIAEQDGTKGFVQHLIMGESAADNPYGVCFSQPHAVDLADVDGDGVLDVVTGKRRWAHNGHDPGGNDPAVLYWFRTVRQGDAPKSGAVEFVPYEIDDHSGVGVDVVAEDITGDGLVDILVGNKYGTFIHVQKAGAEGEDSFSGKLPLQPPVRQDFVENGQTPEEALKRLSLYEGFNKELIVSEPDLVQPVAMTIDARGRLWVAEAISYPIRQPEGEGKDRILIFEDADGNGSFETRKVFMEGLNLVSGLEVGFGGVWVGAAPEFLFIPDQDGDDVPDGEPEVLLDGWAFNDTHETLNAFNWGPDGWLYGCHGVFNHSNIGNPGTPDAERTPMNAGVWRYHPLRHEFEVFAWGSSNPWGVDFNDQGQAFITACVIPHLYHVIQGARYQRQAGTHFNPFVFDDIKTIADHLHFVGDIKDHAHWGGHAPAAPADTLSSGGGHAHCGLSIYLGDNFPDQFRGRLLFNNLHGHCMNQDGLTREGSGYIGRHYPEFMMSNDRWHMGIALRYGPDGGLFQIDWYDQQVCHRRDPEIWDRSNGRLYKYTYGNPEPVKVNLAALSDGELADLMTHRNDWYVRVARRLLQERAAAGTLEGEVAVTKLNALLKDHPDETRRLRAMWALHAMDKLPEPELVALLGDEGEYVRGWSLQLMGEDGTVSEEGLKRSVELAKSDLSPVVRLYLAALLQRLPLGDRWEIAESLAAHKEDAEDHNLPLMLWYGVEPLVPENPGRALSLAAGSKIPKVTNFIYRRLSVEPEGRETLLSQAAKWKDKPEAQTAIVAELASMLRERASVPMPPFWEPAYDILKTIEDPEHRRNLELLGIKFGDRRLLPRFREIVSDTRADLAEREAALEILLTAKDEESVPVFHEIIQGPETPLKEKVIRGLAAFTDEKTPEVLLSQYENLSEVERADAVTTLASNKTYALALLEAVGAERIPRADLGAFTARQLRTYKDAAINEATAKHWGSVGETSKEKKAEMEAYKKKLGGKVLASADLGNGRRLFNQTCYACHRLFGEGNTVGPDITGSNRANLDYLLENIIDPSGVVGKDYRLTVINTKDGRVISGMVRKENESALTVAMVGGDEVVLPIAEVKDREALRFSMMPEGILKPFDDAQVRDLIAYLQSPKQVALTEPGEIRLQGENLKIEKSAGTVRPQGMAHFPKDKWEGDSHLWWTGAKPGDELEIAFEVPETGSFEMSVVMTKAKDYGIVDLSLDGDISLLKNYDLFNAPDVITTGEVSLGQQDLTAGAHTLRVKMVGTNPKALARYMFGLDSLRLMKR